MLQVQNRTAEGFYHANIPDLEPFACHLRSHGINLAHSPEFRCNSVNVRSMFCTLIVHSHTAFDFRKTMYNDAFGKTRSPDTVFGSVLLEDPGGNILGVLDDTLGEPPV